MSRKSAADLSVVADLRGHLPVPLECLTPDQAQIWADVVATKPHDWFAADSFPVLADYCRAVDMDNEIASVVNDFDRARLTDFEGLQSWKALLKMQREQQKHVAMLATKLRLTPQSRYNAKNAATANNRAGLDRPWGRIIPSAPAAISNG